MNKLNNVFNEVAGKIEIKTQKFLEMLNLKAINENLIHIWRPIASPSFKRAGLELLGVYKYKNAFQNIIIWGSSEDIWFKSLEKKEFIKVIKRVIDLNPPLILLSKNVSNEISNIIIDISSSNSVPVVKTNFNISDIHTFISPFLSEIFAPSKQIHGSLVDISGVGVMIIGKSGIGKSEAVLELIQKDYIFISDDCVIVKRIGNTFYGYPSPLTKGFLEARGLGLIDISSIYGKKINRDKIEIKLVVELIEFDKSLKFDRLGNKNLFYEILGSKIDKIQIPVQLGRNTASLIETATYLYITKQSGIDALDTITKRKEEL